MPAEAPAAASGLEQMLSSGASDCRTFIAGLPANNPGLRHAQLLSYAQGVPSGTLAPAAKLEVLELLREPVAEVQAALAKECRGKPLPLAASDNEAWQGTVALWRAMAAGYDALIDAMAGSAPELAGNAHLICQRALRYTAAAMFEYCHIYHSVSGELWQQLHRLYVFSENAGFASMAVDDAVGRRTPATSCVAIYVHALLVQLAQPDALSGAQLDAVDRWLERWESLVTLAPDPLPQSAIPAVAVDLAAKKGAGLARQMPAAGVRHLNLEALSKALRQAAAALKQQTPEQLGLGPYPREMCERLLTGLHVQWCAAGTGRVDERTPASIKVSISPSLASMHYHLTGKAFRQPKAELTAAERQRLDLLGSVSESDEKALASQSSRALETWVIVNQSVSGFLGTAREKDMANRISHQQLVALQPPAKKVMYLGVVQRLNVDEDGMMWIGLRIILGAPQAASVRPLEPAGARYERALLMPEDAGRKIPASIMLMPGWVQPGRVLTLRVEKEKERRIKLQSLLDKGENFERATYGAG
jgi:cyclic-di-GMP-binding protein